MRQAIWLIPFLVLLAVRPTYAQYCNPATVSYIVRDEKGKVLTAAELKSVVDQLPKQIGDADTSTFEVSFNADKQTFYWQDSVASGQGNKVPVLMFSNASACIMHLGEATLQYGGKKMRLVFNLDITRAQDDRRPVIDGLPFQDGAFKLNLEGWTHARDKLIPATRWKRITAADQ